MHIRSELYKIKDKVTQDNLIANWMNTKAIKRRRPCPNAVKKKTRDFHVEYTLCDSTNGQKFKVCKPMFEQVTLFKGRWLNTIAKNLKAYQHIKENRGGDRVSSRSVEKKNKLGEWIKGLKGTESHYSRGKSKRIYLHSEISIGKLRRLYNKQASRSDQISMTMFQKNFCTEFNVGFKGPATDVCSLCTKVRLQIKLAKDEGTKTRSMTQLTFTKLGLGFLCSPSSTQ